MDKVTIYHTIIASHFEYCLSILYTCAKGNIAKLQTLQGNANDFEMPQNGEWFDNAMDEREPTKCVQNIDVSVQDKKWYDRRTSNTLSTAACSLKLEE